MNAQHVRNKNSTVCVYTENRTVPARQLQPCRAGTVRTAPARFDFVYIRVKNRSSTVPARLAFWCKRGIRQRKIRLLGQNPNFWQPCSCLCCKGLRYRWAQWTRLKLVGYRCHGTTVIHMKISLSLFKMCPPKEKLFLWLGGALIGVAP